MNLWSRDLTEQGLRVAEARMDEDATRGVGGMVRLLRRRVLAFRRWPYGEKPR